MKANREQWQYGNDAKVWAGKYRNSHNMPHWHYDCELLYVESGSLDVFCNKTVYRVDSGRAFFIDSEQVHYMHAANANTVISMIIFDYDIIKPFAEKLALCSPLLEGDYGIPKLYNAIMDEFYGGKEFYANAVSYLVALLVIRIFRNEATVPKEKPARAIERFKTLLTKIDESFEFYTLDTAANDMGMNPSYFSRLFHKLTGLTFSQYLNYVKCENAVKLLKTEAGVPVTEIAFRCGFDTIRNFNRIFKEFTGYTPKTLPRDFVMKESFTNLNENSANPTSVECELLESSD